MTSNAEQTNTKLSANTSGKSKNEENSPFKNKLKGSQIKEITYKSETLSVCSLEDLEKVAAALKEAGVVEDKLFVVAFDIARHCADIGSSDFSKPIGKSEHTNMTREEITAIIKRVTTLRRFCAYFSKYVWNHMIMNESPPANYMKKGFKENNKYAAFDTFYAVTSPAALEPMEGLIRKPTQNESSANSSYAELAIFRQAALNGNNSLNLGEITGGRSGNNAICPINNDDRSH